MMSVHIKNLLFSVSPTCKPALTFSLNAFSPALTVGEPCSSWETCWFPSCEGKRYSTLTTPQLEASYRAQLTSYRGNVNCATSGTGGYPLLCSLIFSFARFAQLPRIAFPFVNGISTIVDQVKRDRIRPTLTPTRFPGKPSLPSICSHLLADTTQSQK